MRSFFKTYDNLPDILKTRNVLIRRITVPVSFRLLYSSGIRTTEARLLGCMDVGAGNGMLNIRYSKSHDQHYIAPHDSMADLMRRYDSIIREWFPLRRYFFPASGGTAHPHTWVKKDFRGIWAEVSNDRATTTYAFRHHYATANINRWIGDGFAFDDKLTRLSKSMGHMTLESARYYYSVVPGLSDIVLKETKDGFNESMPEAVS